MAVVILIVLAVVLLASALFVTTARRRRRGVELEPPPARPAATAGAVPRAGAEPTAPPEFDQAQIAEIEQALTGVVPEAEAPPPPPAGAPAPPTAPAPPAPPVEPRFRDRLTKARSLLADYVGAIRGRDRIDDETWDELEEALIRADVGVETTTALLDDLRRSVKEMGIATPDALLDALKSDLKGRLARGDRTLRLDDQGPNVWLFVGVNGVGKTTTIGKIGLQQSAEGHRVIMAAGDTFRAAAADQLELWAQRVGADLVRGAEGADPGAVIFDAVQRAGAHDFHIVLADTAGRLHTKVNLMEELKKVHRVAERPPAHLTEVLLVIDATTGQNGLVQAKEFASAVGVTGVVLTKLDGTAKGGIALAIQTELGIPIKLVGLGEAPEDLVEFDPDEYVDALIA
jgi:fused signal recognition particle receptor